MFRSGPAYSSEQQAGVLSGGCSLRLFASLHRFKFCSLRPHLPALPDPPPHCLPLPPSLAHPELQAPLKGAISYTRVAQSAHFRHNVLAVPHKKSADGERLYYIK